MTGQPEILLAVRPLNLPPLRLQFEMQHLGTHRGHQQTVLGERSSPLGTVGGGEHSTLQ